MSDINKTSHSFEYLEFVKTTDDVIKNITKDVGKSTDLDRVLGFADWAELCLELRESEKRFKKIFDLSPFPICLVSQEGYFIQVNQACVDLWGYSARELTDGMKWQDITLEKDIPLDEVKVKNLVEDKDDEIIKEDLYKTYITKDGKKEFCFLQYTAIREPQGELLYFISVVVSEKLLKDFKTQFANEKVKNNGGFFN